MKQPPIPANESERLANLFSYEVLDTSPEEGFDDLTALASEITGKPIALVSLIDQGRQWFKSRVGLDAEETPRSISFCGHAICGNDVFVVENALETVEFKDNPLVVGDPRVIFYAGAPLTTPDNFRIGTLCVIDHEPGKLTTSQATALERLARQVVSQLELRKRAIELARADAVKSQFIAGLSHEIRTPLNAVNGALQLFDTSVFSENDIELLDVAQEASNTVLELINDVLDLSKIEAGRLELHPVSSKVFELAERVLNIFRGRAEEACVSLTFIADTHLPNPYLLDELRLKQILMNLLSNAIKFTDAGGHVSLAVRTKHDSGQEFIVLEVTDTGIGMSADTVEKVCQPFKQANASIQSKFGGTGLGLAITKRLVALFGGSMNIVSKIGDGSTVSIEIPAKQVPLEQRRPKGKTLQPVKTQKTLIVDDSSTNRMVLDQRLRRFDVPRRQAKSGKEALSIFREQRPDLVLLDLQMPDMDGYEVLNKIRLIEDEDSTQKTRARIVAVTGQAYDDTVKQCLRAGFDDHLAKPVSLAKLADVLNFNRL